MQTYTLTTPLQTGSLAKSTTVSSLQITGISYTSTPRLAPLGSGSLVITLTDPHSGFQETISYLDSSVPAFWAATCAMAPTGVLGDTVTAAVFAKLIADGKLPAGTLSSS